MEQDALLRSFSEARKRARERISLALHDDVCQSITAVGLEMDLFKMDLPADLAERVTEVQQSLEQAFERVRVLSHETHPEPVKRFGFTASMERLAQAARRRFRGEAPVNWDVQRGTAIHDIAEAALDNAIRHSGARRIQLAAIDRKIEIKDDGSGFDTSTPKEGLGLVMMAYWARCAKLTMRLSSSPGRGTGVLLR